MKKLLVLATGLAAVVLSSCSEENENKPQRFQPIYLSEAEYDMVDQANETAYKTFDMLYDREKPTVAFSPLSAQMAIAMTANGAAEETLAELAELVCGKGSSISDVNTLYGNLYAAMPSVDPQTTISIANSVWLDRGISFKDSFTRCMAEYYGAATATYDKHNATAAAAMVNDWVSKSTKGGVSKIVDAEHVEDFMIVNALYFKGQWAERFDKSLTKEKPFACADGTTSRVPFMHKKLQAHYGEIGTTELADLNFGYNHYRMELILPEEGVMPDECLRSLTDMQLRCSFSMNEVNIALPRFKAELNSDLAETYRSMGVESAFNAEKADFKAMTDSEVHLKHVFHNCLVEVDEDGAKAAAATAVSGSDTAIGPMGEAYITLDRPFAFIIRETSTDIIVFMGAVNKL